MQYFSNPLSIDRETPDPFIIRFDGRYYLYFTHPNLLCYSSENLVDWRCEGPIVEDDTFGEWVPFAPEVIYLDGTFYLYTSPSGHGHWVLESESPTGPFTVLSRDLGRNLDASPFLDDDGSLYLYWADDRGIMGALMQSPAVPTVDTLVLETEIGWTEGPQIIKEGGRYYLTYCGTHFLSKGYRIYGAVADHPLGPFVPTQSEPLLVHTEGKLVGVGHCSTVWSPNLLVRYLAYHTLNRDRTRFCNLAPALFGEGKISLLDYRHTEQPFPATAAALTWDVSENSREYRSVEKIVLQDVALEINLRPSSAFTLSIGALCLVFNQGGAVAVTENQVPIAINTAGRKADSFALSTLVIRSIGALCTCYVDGRQVVQWNLSEPYQGKLLLRSTTDALVLSHCQYSYGVPTAAYRSYPVPLASAQEATATSSFAIPVSTQYLLHCWEGTEKSRTLVTERLSLTKGVHQVPPVIEGRELIAAHPRTRTKHYKRTIRVLSSYGTHLFASHSMSSVEIEAEIRRNQIGPSGAFGIAFRVSEHALGGAGDDRVLGIDYLVGYSVMIKAKQITLYRHNFDRRVLAQIAHTMTLGRPISLKVIADKNHIDITVDGTYTITYDDDTPLLHGRVGLRHEAALVDWATIDVTCVD